MLSLQTRRMRSLILILLFSTLTACWGRRPFQPPLASFQVWYKPGASPLQIKKALLECGKPHPQGESSPPKPMRTAIEQAKTENCLLAAGYRKPDDYPRLEQLAAGVPGLPIWCPSTDTQRRAST